MPVVCESTMAMVFVARLLQEKCKEQDIHLPLCWFYLPYQGSSWLIVAALLNLLRSFRNSTPVCLAVLWSEALLLIHLRSRLLWSTAASLPQHSSTSTWQQHHFSLGTIYTWKMALLCLQPFHSSAAKGHHHDPNSMLAILPSSARQQRDFLP